MKYLVHKNGDIIVTPREWNAKFIAYAIQDDYGIEVSLSQADETRVPFTIVDDIRVLPIINNEPQYDPRIQFLAGPIWTITETEAIADWTVQYKDLQQVKNDFKALIAAERYRREHLNTTTEVQGKTITVETGRAERQVFINSALLIPDGVSSEWKFPYDIDPVTGSPIWLVLSKADLQYIISVGYIYVQGCFSWEKDICENQIDPATTHEELITILENAIPPVTSGMPPEGV